MLETVLRLLTTGGVFIGVIAIYQATRNHARQLNAQIFLAYSDRLQSVRQFLRSELLPIWTAELPPEAMARILPCLLQVMHLILELHELKAQGYVKPRTWAIWSRDIDRFLSTPIVRSLHDAIRHEFHGHHAFLAWIDRRQAALNVPPEAKASRHRPASRSADPASAGSRSGSIRPD